MARWIRAAYGSLAFASLLLLPATVLAAAPNHDKISGTFVVDDFCGTGEPVINTVKGILNGWDDQAFGHVTQTWTNPANGASVIDDWAGGGKVSIIDDGDGAYTVKLVRVGRPASLRMSNGALLAHDVGLVAFYDHFDADDNLIGQDLVIVGGPHPFLESDHDLGCELMIAALGL